MGRHEKRIRNSCIQEVLGVQNAGLPDEPLLTELLTNSDLSMQNIHANASKKRVGVGWFDNWHQPGMTISPGREGMAPYPEADNEPLSSNI